MLSQLIKLFKKQPTLVQAAVRQQQEQSQNTQREGLFNLPSDWNPVDSVIDTVRIPGTGLEIGTLSRVVETNRGERVEFNQRRGSRAGCNHFIFSPNEYGGTCPICTVELSLLRDQGQLTQSQVEEQSQYCVQCASFCMACFRPICAAHTRLYQCPDGRFIPLCVICEQATHKSLLGKLFSFLFAAGKNVLKSE